MKKVLSLIMVLTIMLSLVACGRNENSVQTTTVPVTEVPTEPPIQKLNLGETASTKIVDLTIDKAELSVAASPLSTTYMEPTNDTSSMYTATLGHSYVVMTYTVTFKDRGGSYSFEGLPGYVTYNGKEFPLKGYHVTRPDGYSLNMGTAAIVDRATGEVLEKNDTLNYLFHPGESVTFRTFEIIETEPVNWGDAFDLTVKLRDVGDKTVEFTYTVPAK